MTLNSGKLRAIANLLSDPLQAGGAAHVLAREVARPKGQARAMRRSAQKDPRVLLALGARLAAAKRTLSPDAYDAFRRREPELRHETKPERLVADKDQRLIRIASMAAVRDNIDKLPWCWGTLRELPKLGEQALRCLIERGAINRSSTREDVDRLRSAQRSKNVAPRHTGDWKRRA